MMKRRKKERVGRTLGTREERQKGSQTSRRIISMSRREIRESKKQDGLLKKKMTTWLRKLLRKVRSTRGAGPFHEKVWE